jgi:hypothetical protein
MSNKLLNYTTSIEPTKTIFEIQGQLSSHGAKQVMSNYTDNGVIESLSFVIITPEEKAIAIRLPCDPGPVYNVLIQQNREGKIPRSFVTKEQAMRTAWRIVKDWVEAQMALLETQMVKMEEIFLPYAIVKDGKTLFESMSMSRYALLDAKIETSNKLEEGEVVK